jgi:hypothetical protein
LEYVKSENKWEKNGELVRFLLIVARCLWKLVQIAFDKVIFGNFWNGSESRELF